MFTIMVENLKKPPKNPKIVGNHIRQRREALGLSQRSLGQRFNPPVTTQFISNVERGVTPLPPTHVKALTEALQISENEIMVLLEQEYTAKLSGRLGKEGETLDGVPIAGKKFLSVSSEDSALFEKLIPAYQNADPETKKKFSQICAELFKI